MFGKCSNLHQLCIYVVKYIAMNCIYQNQRKLFVFLMFMFLAKLKKEEIEYCALTVGKEKTAVTSPMKVTIGPETIVITNLCHYRHYHHHHHISHWVMEASKLWSFCLKKEKRWTGMEENQIYCTINTTVFGCLNLISKIYWLRWTKMGLCSPPDIARKSSKYRPGLWDFFGVTRETLGNSESTAKDRAVSLFHVHFIPAWHHHLHLTICQPSSPQRCHHHQHYPHVIKPVF